MMTFWTVMIHWLLNDGTCHSNQLSSQLSQLTAEKGKVTIVVFIIDFLAAEFWEIPKEVALTSVLTF